MHNEIVEFVKAGKPVVFMHPGVVPERFLQDELKLPEAAVKRSWSSAGGWTR
jgi:hypothetical protein